MSIKENVLDERSSVVLADDQLRILWLDGGVLKSRRIPIDDFLTSIYASPTFTGTVVLPSGQILTQPTIASFVNANHTHAAAGETGGVVTTGPHQIALGSGPAVNPGDASTFYSGSLMSSSQVADVQRFYFQRIGTITKARLFVRIAGTLGTTEAVAAYIRVNNTTDTTISTSLDFSATPVTVETALSLAISAVTDYFELKFVFPTWITNPTSVQWGLMLYYGA